MFKEFKISVVVPLFNKEGEVIRALQSVLHQTHEPAEIIVIDDGSTDSSASVVESLGDNRIRIINRANAGVSAARNVGIRAASNSHIAFLDADDEWLPHFLEEIFSLIRMHPEAGLYATQYLFCEKNGAMRQPILRHLALTNGKGLLEDYFGVAAHSDPPVCSSAVVCRSDILGKIGGFPGGIRIGEDLLTWARIAAQLPVVYSTRPSAIFHLQAPLAGRPSRSPELPDRVGMELKKLLSQIPKMHVRSFRQYCATWHKMRASMFIQLDNRSEAFKEVRSIAEYDLFSSGFFLYGGLSVMPKMIRGTLLRSIDWLKKLRRKHHNGR
ncbi:MAG: glycosyltransferase [Ignavibacteriales bacterium]|nr:glycosyltransferase [Ignavibacteriales bacterium]